MTKKPINTLFLHGGPGLHCAMEREWFGDSLPVSWWDQPAVAGNPAPFHALLSHAARQSSDGAMPDISCNLSPADICFSRANR